MERTFAAAHPRYSLQIGSLHYNLWKNRVACDSLTLARKDSGASYHVAGLSIQGLGRIRLLLGRRLVPEVFAHARLTATNLVFNFPAAGYAVHCGRLQVTPPEAQIVAEAIEVHPLMSDEQFFAARPFRRTRLDLVIPQCQVEGLTSVGWPQGKGYHARSIQIQDVSLNAYLNRDKPANPAPHGPFTVKDALAMLPHPLTVDYLDIINGQITFRERVAPGKEPGVLTFDGVRISAEGISNQAAGKAAVTVNARARFMNASTLELFLQIPTVPAERSLRYSGSFSALDLAKLNPFLEPVVHTRITSGILQEAIFNIDVTAGHASGQLRALYQDLQFAFLDRQTGSDAGIGNEVKSFLADHIMLHTSNPSAPSAPIQLGVVDYTWKPEERVLHFLWFALRSGIFNVLGLDEYVSTS